MSATVSILSHLAKTSLSTTESDLAMVLSLEDTELVVSAAALSDGDSTQIVGLTSPANGGNISAQLGLSESCKLIRKSDHLPQYFQLILERYGIRCVIGATFVCESGSQGVLLLGSKRKRYLHSVEQSVQALADMAAISIDRNKLLSTLERELRDLKWLGGITEKIRLEEGRDKVIQAVLDAASEVLSADAVAIYLHKDGSNKLSCVAANGLPISLVDAKTHEQQQVLSKAMDSAEPLFLPDIQTLSPDDPFREVVLDISIRSIIALQLRHRGKPMGLLMAMHRRPNVINERRNELCHFLALNTAVALNYSRLLEQSRSLVKNLEEVNVQLEMQAVHDGLTGLSNHRSFHQRLTEQIHRVGRYKEKFSVAMIDVDHFKAYNDAFGHQEGDTALREIARIISEQLRDSDFAARYGGEEFAIIFPHTQKASARIALERIRNAIDEFTFPNGKVTISAGLAECPTDGVTANEVLELADRTLYHAKLTGRNRVCVWGSQEESKARLQDGTESRIRVLVVENDSEARRAVEEALVQAGYELHRAASTQEAVSLLRSQKFDIMLSDAIILDAEGMQVLGLASSIHPTMPIVVTAVASMAGAVREAMSRGVTDLLVKPFNEHELPVIIERNLERKRIERQMLLEKSTGILLQAIDALVAAIDAKDRLTAGHSSRVTHFCLGMADVLGLASEDRYTLELAARLHDIGKLALPDSALNKPGKLTDEEWAAMRRHPAVGSQIVGAIEELGYIATIVRHHHERLDGNGYPDGLQGEAIPYLSRIIAVADAFEAMTSERAYRGKMSNREAIAELKRCVGTHYSEEIIDALVIALETEAPVLAEDQAA